MTFFIQLYQTSPRVSFSGFIILQKKIVATVSIFKLYAFKSWKSQNNSYFSGKKCNDKEKKNILLVIIVMINFNDHDYNIPYI
jgi:hypothetical protein